MFAPSFSYEAMYNFKKNAKLYIVEGGNKHSINIYSDISASQTFDEQSYKLKTLHNLNNLHEGATITKASPANFGFTTPILDATSAPVILRLATDYTGGNIPSFDVYIESDNVRYKLEKAVIESSTFNISMDSVLTVSISGSASKLSVHQGSIPGTPVVDVVTGYVKPTGVAVTINSIALESIASLNIEVANDVSWTPNSTLHKSLSNNIAYPESYTIQGRRVSGSITQFLTSDNVASLSDTTTTSPIVIDIFTAIGQTTPFLKFNLPSSVFTRRLNMDELFNRVYDFRLNSNSTNVKPIYKGV